ncbi:MAG: primosomal protein N' [Parcubacteria group bacterium]|nr:primosomal protein N' [Parcubacteria group bacterium]
MEPRFRFVNVIPEVPILFSGRPAGGEEGRPMLGFTYRVPEEFHNQVGIGSIVTIPFGRQELRGVVVAEKAIPPSSVVPKEIVGVDPLIRFTPPWQKLMHSLMEETLAPPGLVVHAMLPPQPGRRLIRSAEATPPMMDTARPAFAFTSFSHLRLRPGGYSLLPIPLGFEPCLIYEAIARRASEEGGQTLILVPEIERGKEIMGLLGNRWGARLGFIHSRLPRSEERLLWEGAVRGANNVVIGTRKALFVPFPKLSAIVIDSEHESGHNQYDQAPHYDVRHAAIMLARETGIRLLIVSHTPRIAVWHQARTAKRIASLPTKIEPSVSPSGTGDVAVIDARPLWVAKTSTLLAPKLVEVLREVVRKQGRALLITHRRGFGAAYLCAACHRVAICPRCGIPLKVVRNQKRILLHCSQCDSEYPPFTRCQFCQARTLRTRGAGIERVMHELQTVFPGVPLAHFDRESVASPASRGKLITEFLSRPSGILVGTPMLVGALPSLPVHCIAMLAIDSMLSIPDFRTHERLVAFVRELRHRALQQVPPPKIVWQTYIPDHPAVRAALSFDPTSFYESELKERKVLYYPPFVRLIRVRFSRGKGKESFKKETAILRDLASLKKEGIRDILGPSPSATRGEFAILIKISPKEPRILAKVRKILPGSWRIVVDPEYV